MEGLVSAPLNEFVNNDVKQVKVLRERDLRNKGERAEKRDK